MIAWLLGSEMLQINGEKSSRRLCGRLRCKLSQIESSSVTYKPRLVVLCASVFSPVTCGPQSCSPPSPRLRSLRDWPLSLLLLLHETFSNRGQAFSVHWPLMSFPMESLKVQPDKIPNLLFFLKKKKMLYRPPFWDIHISLQK